MRHQAEDVAAAVADAGDVARGAIRVRLARHAALGVAIAEDDLAVALEVVEHVVVGEVVPLAVRDRGAQHLAGCQLRGERRRGLIRAQADVAADEAEVLVAHQRAGQQPRLGEHLEAVADAEDQAAVRGVAADRLHHRRELRERAGAEVVAVCEAARDDHAVGAVQVGLLVPEELRLFAEDVLGDVQRVVVAVRAGKDDDREFHVQCTTAARGTL